MWVCGCGGVGVWGCGGVGVVWCVCVPMLTKDLQAARRRAIDAEARARIRKTGLSIRPTRQSQLAAAQRGAEARGEATWSHLHDGLKRGRDGKSKKEVLWCCPKNVTTTALATL